MSRRICLDGICRKKMIPMHGSVIRQLILHCGTLLTKRTMRLQTVGEQPTLIMIIPRNTITGHMYGVLSIMWSAVRSVLPFFSMMDTKAPTTYTPKLARWYYFRLFWSTLYPNILVLMTESWSLGILICLNKIYHD